MCLIIINIIGGRRNPLSIAVQNITASNLMGTVDVRPEDDLILDDLLADAALVELRRLVDNPDVLPSCRRILEQLVACHTTTAAVRI